MTILDAYAVLAYLRNEPAAGELRPLLDSAEASLTAAGLAEVVDHLRRLVGADEEAVMLNLAELDLPEAIPVDAALGASAGRLRARRFHRAAARSAWPTTSPRRPPGTMTDRSRRQTRTYSTRATPTDRNDRANSFGRSRRGPHSE